MCDNESTVRLSWQLVSQFVSWEFCRYISEQNENQGSEVDVLTYLRNMIVEKTDKSVLDITKHEIIAKFVMEIKAIRTISRLSCVSDLSETVMKICPELKPSVVKLLHHLETFVNLIDGSSDYEKGELIELRIEDAIENFCKEATKILPMPNLIQVVDFWVQQHTVDTKSQPSSEDSKSSQNISLLQRVLNCLSVELITPTEAKIIAVALFEDKELEKIILESDTETTYDSLQFPHFSQSVNSEISHLEQLVQSPEQVSSENSLQMKPSQTYRQLQSPKSSPNKPYLKQSQLEKFLKHSPEHFQLEKPLHNSSVSEHFQLEKPPESSHSKVSVYPAKDANSDDFIPSKNPVDVNRPWQPELSSESDLEEDFAHLLQNKSVASKKAEILQIRDSDSEDTSDCDKNADFRFLTPTMFKKDAPKQPQTKFVYLSDSESNGSSIITTFVDSQPTDPSWKEHSRHLNKLSTRNKRVPPSKPAVRDKRIPQNKPVFQDKGIPENEDTSENEDTKHAVNSENEDANCTDNSENKNTTHAVATRIKTATQPKLAVQICETRQRPVKKRKLYQPSKHPVAISYQLGSKQINKKSTIPNSLIPSFFNSLASETNEVNQDCVFRTEKPPRRKRKLPERKRRCRYCEKFIKTSEMEKHYFIDHNIHKISRGSQK